MPDAIRSDDSDERPRTPPYRAKVRSRGQGILAVSPERYARLGLELSTRPPPELSLPRPSLGRLLAARSGHGDFEAYHVRFHHEDAELLCRCGDAKAPEHFATCVAANPPFGRVVPFGKDPVEWALGTIPGAKAFSEWAINS